MAVMKIVVGIDDGPTSVRALRRACSFAGTLDAELHVVFVSHVPATVLAAMSGLPTIGDDFAEAQRTTVWQQADPILSSCSQPVTKLDLEGYPPDVLVEYAAEIGAGLIVIGSRGRGDLASLVLGSTSHRVVNNAPCDVLVVRAAEEKE
jgi:nucleotide-binding universal stress UspA family protein